jgi:trigger factor
MAIKAKLKTRTPCEMIIESTVEQPDLEAAYERTFKRYNRWLEMPGFRIGKAPREMVEQKYADQLKAATLEDLANAVIRSVIKQHHLDPVTSPRITDEPEYPESGPLSFSAEFEVAPAVELKEYSGLKLTKRKAEITPKEVDETLQSILEQYATFEEITENREAAFGDWIVADYTGSVEGQEILKREKAWIEISSETNLPVPGFGDELLGVKQGEIRDFTTTAPSDFFKKDYAGKPVSFKVSVTEIRERRMPELTEELIKKIDQGCSTEDDLREAITKNQLQYRDAQEKNRLRELAREQLVNTYKLPLPPTLVSNRTRRLIEEEARSRMQKGQTEEQIKEQLEELQKQCAIMAETQLRAEYILDAIARKEKITVTEEDIMPQLQYYAQAFRRDIQWVRRMFEREGQLEALQQTAIENKALDLVLEKAEITEK